MAGRSRLQNSLPPSPFSSSHLHIIWPFHLSLVPEVQGKFFLLPELPLALQEGPVQLDKGAGGGVGGVSPSISPASFHPDSIPEGGRRPCAHI